MTQTRPDKMQKRAAALRENLRRRKPKSSGKEEKQAQKQSGKSKNPENKE